MEDVLNPVIDLPQEATDQEGVENLPESAPPPDEVTPPETADQQT